MAEVSLVRTCYILMGISMVLLFFAVVFWIIGGVNDSFKEEFVGTMLFATSGMIIGVMLFIVMCCAQYGERCTRCYDCCPSLVPPPPGRIPQFTPDSPVGETGNRLSSTSSWLDRHLLHVRPHIPRTPVSSTGLMVSLGGDSHSDVYLDFPHGTGSDYSPRTMEPDSTVRDFLNSLAIDERRGNVHSDEPSLQILGPSMTRYSNHDSTDIYYPESEHDLSDRNEIPPSYDTVISDNVHSDSEGSSYHEDLNELPPTYEEVTTPHLEINNMLMS
ncbi:uncharacterized protein LOC144435904 [Glandiceps talaboti]